MPDDSQTVDKLYIIREGEWMGKVARKFNVRDPEDIYNHDPNEPLRNIRPEKDILAPGDEVWVPITPQLEAPTKGKNGGPVAITVTSSPTEKFDVRLKNENYEELSDVAYEASYFAQEDEDEISGTTGADGKVEGELPLGTEIVIVNAEIESENRTFNLNMGHLEPATSLHGACSRLKNLSVYNDEFTRRLTSKLYEAICKFQEDNELAITGKLDPETVTALRDRHGC